MIDGNISMEEDTELRDLVVQTLENNGVLAKVRAELRASVFLALEEQESVANPEPLLNKTVKQYLANSEGKLLFSLVREFLEYFGLDYTISVYDPETYIGKEYNYLGRNKLCEKLGINSTEPLLGELLKNTINSVLNNSEKNDLTNDSRLNKTNEISTNFNNATFEVSVSKIVDRDSTSLSNDNDASEKIESMSEDISQEIPINVTITDKKNSSKTSESYLLQNDDDDDDDNDNDDDDADNPIRDNENLIKAFESVNIEESENNHSESSSLEVNQNICAAATTCPNHKTKVDHESNVLNKSNEHLIKFDDSAIVDTIENCNVDQTKSKLNSVDLQYTNNNAQNRRKIDVEKNFAKTVYFEEIIVDGKKEKVGSARKTESLLGELPPIVPKTNSIFSDLPPLNGKKTNINDLKELMDIGLTGDVVDNYEEDFISSASGSANEQSPIKGTEKNADENLKQGRKDEKKNNSACSEENSEEIDEIEEVLSANVSCLDDAGGHKS